MRAALTVQDAVEQEPGGQELAALRRAKRYGSLAAYRSFARLRLGGEMVASGRRPDTNIVTAARLEDPGYTVVNFTGRYDFARQYFLAAKLENAFDKRYQLVHGFDTPRRGVFLTAGWTP